MRGRRKVDQLLQPMLEIEKRRDETQDAQRPPRPARADRRLGERERNDDRVATGPMQIGKCARCHAAERGKSLATFLPPFYGRVHLLLERSMSGKAISGSISTAVIVSGASSTRV